MPKNVCTVLNDDDAEIFEKNIGGSEKQTVVGELILMFNKDASSGR